MSKEPRSHFSPNKRLIQARLARGWSQEDVASQIGTEGNTVNRWERGRARPRPYFRQKLCDLFGQSAQDLGLVSLLQEQVAPMTASVAATNEPAFHWQVPHLRNPFFTGREVLLDMLHQRLRTDHAVALTQSYALHGLGGIGKTQVALEYAYRYALDYSAVFWIEAETSESILASMDRIAAHLQLPEQGDADQQRMVAAVQRWLTTNGICLLIWDNVEDLELLQRFLRQGAILITTRNMALGTLAQSIELPPMMQEEGTVFVLRRAKFLQENSSRKRLVHDAKPLSAQEEEAQELVRVMGGYL